jgi:multidrug efflux system outer membrane protein
MKRVIRFPALIGLAACVLACIGASGCTVGPKYQRATSPVPAKWDVVEPWRESAPKDGVAKGEWWSVFHDDELSALEKQALDANQTGSPAGAGASVRCSADRNAIPCSLDSPGRPTPEALR